MRVTLLTLALVGLAIANPIPQEIDFAQVQVSIHKKKLLLAESFRLFLT